MIENVRDIHCIVLVRSPEGEQRFDLDVGGSVAVTGIATPIEVVAVSSIAD